MNQPVRHPNRLRQARPCLRLLARLPLHRVSLRCCLPRRHPGPRCRQWCHLQRLRPNSHRQRQENLPVPALVLQSPPLAIHRRCRSFPLHSASRLSNCPRPLGRPRRANPPRSLSDQQLRPQPRYPQHHRMVPCRPNSRRPVRRFRLARRFHPARRLHPVGGLRRRCFRPPWARRLQPRRPPCQLLPVGRRSHRIDRSRMCRP